MTTAKTTAERCGPSHHDSCCGCGILYAKVHWPRLACPEDEALCSLRVRDLHFA